MNQGLIMKGIGGFYYVDTGSNIVECRARGKFRKDKITPLIGDLVDIEEDETNNQGYIINIHKRKNQMIRPAVSNIDQAVIVFAAQKPDINMKLLQRLLVYSEYSNIYSIICINKIDLDDHADYKSVVTMLESIPYRIIETSVKMNKGITELKDSLKDKITVFAGSSGVGKSSLLNSIEPGLGLKIGDLSKKIERGTHTTRHAELMKLENGGMVLDTPGFSSLDLVDLEPSKLQLLFPEFSRHMNCRYTGCMHVNERDCAIKNAVENEEISEVRYEYYKIFLQELINNRRY